LPQTIYSFSPDRLVFANADTRGSHVYRRTVATLMDAASLSARQAADQLGHAKVSMTQDNYFGRKVARTGAAEVLEIFADHTQSR
jgi:integrase